MKKNKQRIVKIIAVLCLVAITGLWQKGTTLPTAATAKTPIATTMPNRPLQIGISNVKANKPLGKVKHTIQKAPPKVVAKTPSTTAKWLKRTLAALLFVAIGIIIAPFIIPADIWQQLQPADRSHSTQEIETQSDSEESNPLRGVEKNSEASEKEQANDRNRPNEPPNAGNRPQKHTKPDASERY